MSLPKRDGVHDRCYLIHRPDTSPEVLAEADLCIQDVLNGTARENHSDYPTVVRNHNGTPFLPDQLLERYLSRLPLKGFSCEDAVSLCDAMRRLVGWEEIRYELEKYIEKQVQERYFVVGQRSLISRGTGSPPPMAVGRNFPLTWLCWIRCVIWRPSKSPSTSSPPTWSTRVPCGSFPGWGAAELLCLHPPVLPRWR